MFALYENFGYGKWREGCGCIRASGGDAGGGSEMLCVGRSREWNGGVSPTLIGDHENRITDYTSVICEEVYPQITGSICANTHPGGVTGQDANNDLLPTIKINTDARKYIVRRLMPLECGRLQGFPDGWGDLANVQNLSDAEVVFWDDIRKVHAEVNGKKYKPFKNKESLIKWLNGLHTDSAEYKMWGNGIALPCASFVVGGVADALREELLNE